MKKTDRFIIGAIIACGLALAVLKASAAALTTDEAWVYSRWISAGFRTILTDFSDLNNHLLQSALSRASLLLLGDSEFALRYPSIIAYLVFAFAFIKLIEAAVSDRTLRLVCFGLVMLHPYIIDFAALARGYMIMIALNTLSLYFLLEAFNSGKARRCILYLVLSSYFLGMSAAAVPGALRLLPAFLLVLLIQGRSRKGVKPGPAHLAALALPAIAVAAAFYVPAISNPQHLTLNFGTRSLLESLQSVRLIFFYTPTLSLDAGGNPAPSPETQLLWNSQSSIQWLHLLLAGNAVLALFLLDMACTMSCPFRFRLKKPASFIHIIWLTLAAIVLLQRYVSGAPLPTGRAWLVFVPLPIITAFAIIEELMVPLPHKGRLQLAIVVSSLAVMLAAVRLDSFSVLRHWEWPDNGAAPAVVNDLSSLLPPGTRSSVSCPEYYHACLMYYMERFGLKDVDVVPGQDAPAEYHLLRKPLLTEPMPRELVEAEYPDSGLILIRDRSTPLQR